MVIRDARGLRSHRVPSGLLDAYLSAKDIVLARGFAWEIDWQAERRLDRVSESEFLRECGWTVLSSGFRESIVRKCFGAVSEAFLHWHSAREICANRARCRESALSVFSNKRKIDAILGIACLVADCGFESVRSRIGQEEVSFLQTLPYIGPVTAFHLAKNIGLPVVKPDRHLSRIACAAGICSPRELCELISERLGEPIQVVDIVLWRYATLCPDYLEMFAGMGDEGALHGERDAC